MNDHGKLEMPGDCGGQCFLCMVHRNMVHVFESDSSRSLRSTKLEPHHRRSAPQSARAVARPSPLLPKFQSRLETDTLQFDTTHQVVRRAKSPKMSRVKCILLDIGMHMLLVKILLIGCLSCRRGNHLSHLIRQGHFGRWQTFHWSFS